MDYLLENQNLGLLEKNKKIFTDLSKDNNESGNPLESESNKDTFKMYTDFMTEKQGLLEIIDEMVKFSTNQLSVYQSKADNKISTPENLTVLKSIKNQSDFINFKNRVIMILENYQEQPGLLDPILGQIVPNLMNNSLYLIESLLKNRNEFTLINLQCLYQIVYILCKIRGYSTIIKFFSSEVHVFEPVITFLLSLNPMDTDNWFLLYVLLLWTSILGLIPFDIETIDTNNIITSGLFEYYKKTLNLSGVLRDIAAYSLSKFLTRPDVIRKGLLDNFIHYSINVLQSEQMQLNIFELLGVLSSLCEIFKNGLPGDMIKYAEIVVNKVIRFKYDILVSNSGIFMKYLCKLSQRVGLVLLKPKFQKWRYQMKLSNLLGSKNNPSNNASSDTQIHNPQYEEDDLNYDIDFELLETIIDFLLTNLSHKEYIVRWSSAKGLGRLCERLTKQMVDDILQNIFNLFENEENEYSWQGACLCIAELCKRGMILPEKLGTIVQYLEKALVFEVNKGTFCTGSSVRDSACYVVWALARAYTREVMKPYVNKIVKSLILTILFDKEVNCRRAASAAFQEHVGRQGYFPHGIEIITEADYFTLGNRIYCYLHISTFIAQYPEYYQTIVDYLSFNRLIHVESNIRTISAEALGLLVPFHPEYFVNIVLPKLLNLCYSKTLHVRHGAIVGIGYILVGLSGKWDFEQKARKIRKKILEGMNSNEKKVLEDSEYRKMFEQKYEMIKYNNSMYLISDELMNQINSIPENLDNKNLYRGKGAELMRTAINNLIRLISESNLNVNKKQINYFFDILIDNLKHPNNDIQKEACEGLRLLNETYTNVINEEQSFIEEIEKKFLQVIKLAVTDENIYITKGFTMSIPYFDSKLILRNYPAAMESLYTNAKIKKTNNNDAETRKFALESLCWLSCKFIQEYVKNIS
jgi:tubulin-specific chaperone D